MSVLVISALLSILLTTIFLFIKLKFSYWKRRGVPFLKPTIPFGNFGPTFQRKRAFGQNIHDLYNASVEPIEGIYYGFRPILLIRDPKITKDILIKDFHNFRNRGFHFDTTNDPLAANLFFSDEKWREMRIKLSPAFTTGKLRAMVQTIVDCGKSLEDCVMECANGRKEIEVGGLFSLFMTNVVASIGFGLEIDCFKHPDNDFRQYTRRFFEDMIHWKNTIRFNVSFVSPFITKLLKFRFVDEEVANFMIEIVRQNLDYREKNRIIRKDFFQLLIQLRNAGKVQNDDDINDDGDNGWSGKANNIINSSNGDDSGKSLTLNEMAAQSFSFVNDGYSTSSTTMTFCMYELAKKPTIQQRVSDEIRNTLEKYNGNLNYEALSEMKYLDSCIDGMILDEPRTENSLSKINSFFCLFILSLETLRMHPPFDSIFRECTTDYKIPDTEFVIEEGTAIFFSVSAPQYDSKYYDQPNEFNPERFLGNQLANKNSLEMPYLTFGDGPRNCIGMRLGKLKAKIGVCLLLQKFSFELGERLVRTGLQIDPRARLRTPLDGIHLAVNVR